MRLREASLHPWMLAGLKAAAGSRPELAHPRIQVIRFQGEPQLIRVAGVVGCGAVHRGFTAEFRTAAGGWWLTHLGVL